MCQEEVKRDLMQFEEEIRQLFLAAKIRAPVHLSRGNEEPLIKIFKHVRRTDWVFSTHRSHYHALLHGIDKEWLRSEILAGRSMHINSREHRFFASPIVGGTLPIALGVAVAIKRKRSKRHVWAFVGDMAAESGIFHECTKYAARHNLPITFVVEDNGLSTNTPTQEVWGEARGKPDIIRYEHKRVWPHQNVETWVIFE